MSESISSIPPPCGFISPFPADRISDGCYISLAELKPADEVVLIPVGDGTQACPANLGALHQALELASDAEKRSFNDEFLAYDLGRKKVLLWRKLMRHNKPLFAMLLHSLGATQQ